MPFPNFHSGRVKSPDAFVRIRVLQTLPNGVMIYGGPLKTDPRGSGKPQAYRFPKDKFTATEAKTWLKEHNITTILFEPATGMTQFEKKTFSIDKDILSVGTWNGIPFTKEDLDEMAGNFELLKDGDPEFKNGVPFKIDLFKNINPGRHGGQPAFGWVKEIWTEGEKLFAKITNIPRLIKEMIESKQYREVSAEVGFNKWFGNERLSKVLKGVALLGVELPAVENLDEFEQFYSLNTDESESTMSFTVETNNQNNPIEEEEDMDSKELEAKNKKLEEENAKLKKDNEKLDSDNKKLETEKKDSDTKLSKTVSEERTKEIKAFVKEKVKEGKTLPRDEESTISILESLSDEKTIKFSKDGKDEMVSPRELRQIEIDGSPNVVEFSEKLKKEKDAEQGKDLNEELKTFKKNDDSTELEEDQKAHHIVTERIAKFQKENIGKDVKEPSYEEVLNQVYKDYPDLG